jgi:hypothetical protein
LPFTKYLAQRYTNYIIKAEKYLAKSKVHNTQNYGRFLEYFNKGCTFESKKLQKTKRCLHAVAKHKSALAVSISYYLS